MGKRFSPREEAERWFEQAKADLAVARDVFAAGHHYFVCFLAQQVAEKALKGFLYSRGEEDIIGHSVEELCAWCGELIPAFAELRERISILDTYYLPTRYPNALPGGIPARTFNRAAAEQALALAESALSFSIQQAEKGDEDVSLGER